MKIYVRDYNVPFRTHKLYDVICDNEEIETVVTHDPGTVRSWIDNTESLHHYRLHRLIVGLDVEWRPNFGSCQANHVATLQLCVANSCLIFQILHASKIPRRLREFLGDPDYTFVGVGIKQDISKLRDDYNLWVSKARDLRVWAAKELDDKDLRQAGLKDLVLEVLGEEMKKPKNVILSRWDNKYLTKHQIAYACLDAYFSFEIGRSLSAWY